MGDVVIAGMDPAEQSLKELVRSDIIGGGIDQSGLIRDIVSELAIFFDTDNIAVSFLDRITYRFLPLVLLTRNRFSY